MSKHGEDRLIGPGPILSAFRSERPGTFLSGSPEPDLASFPELMALKGVPQDPTWHPEGDVWIHTMMALDAAAEIVRRDKMPSESAEVVLLAVLCHDFGKPATTALDHKTGRIRAIGHAEAGVPPAKTFMARLEVPTDVREKVKKLVLEHLNPMALFANRDKVRPTAVRRLAERTLPASIEELLAVCEADQRGRALPWFGFPAGEWVRSWLL